MDKAKKFMETSWWERLTEGETGSCSDGWGCVPSLLFDLRPNYGGGSEDNGYILQKVFLCTHCCTRCSRPCCRPPVTHASAGDSCTLTGKSGSVSCRVTAPFSWIPVCTRFCLCPPRVCFSSPPEGGSMEGLMVTSSKKAYAILRSAAPRASAPAAVHCWPEPPLETLKHSKEGLTQSLWGVLVHTSRINLLRNHHSDNHI